MEISRIVLLLWNLLGFQVLAAPLNIRNATDVTFPEITPSTSLMWLPCYSGFFCAMLDVPLDYTDPSKGRSAIPLIKQPATTSPYLGMLLFNPGGPGDSGTETIPVDGSVLLPYIGTNWDLVSWDPRGVGFSLPAFKCNVSNVQARSENLNEEVLSRRGFFKILGPNLPSSDFETAYNDGITDGENCLLANDLASQHLTTSNVARDMLSIVTAFSLTPDGQQAALNSSLANYWGASYGTFLGQTFASLFPDRIGRFVLDGNLDPDDWVAGTSFESVNNSDDVMASYFIYCYLAGPEKCGYYTGNSARDIYDRFERLIGESNSSISRGINGQSGRERLRDLLYVPDPMFRFMNVILNELESEVNGSTTATGNLTKREMGIWRGGKEVPAIIGGGVDTAPMLNAPVNDYTFAAIKCSDTGGRLFGKSLESFGEGIRYRERQSWTSGDEISLWWLPCAGWGVEDKAAYLGPFGGKTNNPILFVSNTLDPITPHVNGEKGARLYHNAELLTIEGLGHTSLAPSNKCSVTKMNNYFQNGTMPGKDNFCPDEGGPWGIILPSGSLEKRQDFLDIKNSFKSLKRK